VAADILSDGSIVAIALESTQFARNLANRRDILPVMREPTVHIPTKLKARRVRDHVATTLSYIQRVNMQRDARRVRVIDEVSWESHDLYTLALDICEDAELRSLVLQARGAILTALTR
jgi:hypothetical protein